MEFDNGNEEQYLTNWARPFPRSVTDPSAQSGLQPTKNEDGGSSSSRPLAMRLAEMMRSSRAQPLLGLTDVQLQGRSLGQSRGEMRPSIGQRILGLAPRLSTTASQVPQPSLGFGEPRNRDFFNTFIPQDTQRPAVNRAERNLTGMGAIPSRMTNFSLGGVASGGAGSALNRAGFSVGSSRLRTNGPGFQSAKSTTANLQIPEAQRPRAGDTLSYGARQGRSLEHPQTSAGSIESNPVAWNAMMESLDSMRVGEFTVGELANVLTNESRDLGPNATIFDNDLDRAKYVQAHAIINNALRRHPNPMANRTITAAAVASPGRDRDVEIMRNAYYDRMTKGSDPAEGRTYFGNSADLILKDSPIGNSRHTVFARFGPFTLGSQEPRYIYIYNDPIPRENPKKAKHRRR
jgi:hypothetical protein